MDLISKTTRNEFREALVGFVLRELEMFFEGAGLSSKEDYNPPVTGERRTLVEQYLCAHSSHQGRSPTVDEARRI